MTSVPASRPRRGTTPRRLLAAWIAGAFLLLGLPVTTASATASPATPQGQVLRPSGVAGTPKLRVERPSDPRLARPVDQLRLLPRPYDHDTHAAVLPATLVLRAARYLGLAASTVPPTDSVPGAVARGRGPPAPAIASAGPDAFLGRPDASGALSDPTA